MNDFEDAMAADLGWMLRAGVPVRAVRLTVHERVLTRVATGQPSAADVREVAEAAVRAACRLVRELDAPDEVVEAVCRGALAAVRGHGGLTAQWLPDAADRIYAVLDELARERADDVRWRWLARHVADW
jgi:hypothetical protein